MQPTPDDPVRSRRNRRVGAVVLVLITLVLAFVTLQGRRGQRDRAVDEGVRHLAQASCASGPERTSHLQAAEKAFAQAASLVTLEPLALTGLAVAEGLGSRLGAKTPPPPELGALTADDVARYVRDLVVSGRPGQALQWAGQPAVQQHTSPSLRHLLQLAERMKAAGGCWQD